MTDDIAAKRFQARMNEPFAKPSNDPFPRPLQEERIADALEYIASQLYWIRRALEAKD